MRQLTQQELHALETDPGKLIELVTGMNLWSPAQVSTYKESYMASHGLPWWSNIYNVCMVPVSVVLIAVCITIECVVGIVRIFAAVPGGFGSCTEWSKEKLFPKGFFYKTRHWPINHLGDDGCYFRDGTLSQAPDFVMKIVRQITSVLPDVFVSVSFYGTDPILVARLPCQNGWQDFYPLVWDEDSNGVPFIVPPPVTAY